jgi:DNA-binding transcriptional ArsR family regulator
MSPSRAAAARKLPPPDAAPVFAALGDTTRLGLLGRLSADGPLSISHLSEGTGVTRQAITRHLDALEKVGLVQDARRGRERIFSLDAKRLEVARQYLDHVAAQWNAAAARLKAFVEDDRDSIRG